MYMSHRDDLLAAARQLLQDQGYARTSARDLVAASRTNLGSIGYHFGSKDALLQQAMGELFEEWTAQLTRAALAPDGAGPFDRLDLAWSRMLDSFEEHRPLARAWTEALAQASHNAELRAALAAHYERTRQGLAAVVHAALGDDAVREGADPEVIASFLIAICDGLLVQFLLDPERRPSGEALSAALGAAVTMGLREDVAGQ
jgi:AcrR family transcriptional regulator